MSLKHLGNAVFLDTDPLDQDPHLHPYVEFPSLERVVSGIAWVEGDKIVDQVEVHEGTMEPIARYWEFNDALTEIRSGSKYGFEEEPYALVSSPEEWDEILDALDREPEDWEGPGLYDMRDDPPSRSYESIEDYEFSDMDQHGEWELEYLFQGDEWEEAVTELVERNS